MRKHCDYFISPTTGYEQCACSLVSVKRKVNEAGGTCNLQSRTSLQDVRSTFIVSFNNTYVCVCSVYLLTHII